MPKPEPKPAMRRREGGMTKAVGAGVHPFVPTERIQAPPKSKPLPMDDRKSVNEARSTLGVRISDDILQEMRHYAVETRMSQRDITEAAIREYLDRHPVKK